MNRGATATMTPTFEAVVYTSAMFSMRKYSVTPQAPAATNSSSSRQPATRKRRGRMAHSAAKPSAKRKNRISIGEQPSSSTFVDTNVTPQMSTVTSASPWPRAAVGPAGARPPSEAGLIAAP